MPVNDVSGDHSQCAAQISETVTPNVLTNVIGPKIFVSGQMTVYREAMGLRAANHMAK